MVADRIYLQRRKCRLTRKLRNRIWTKSRNGGTKNSRGRIRNSWKISLMKSGFPFYRGRSVLRNLPNSSCPCRRRIRTYWDWIYSCQSQGHRSLPRDLRMSDLSQKWRSLHGEIPDPFSCHSSFHGIPVYGSMGNASKVRECPSALSAGEWVDNIWCEPEPCNNS